MTNLVMAIALWCGNPLAYTDPAMKRVDQCRQELFQCVEKDPNGNKFLDCFKNKKLN